MIIIPVKLVPDQATKIELLLRCEFVFRKGYLELVKEYYEPSDNKDKYGDYRYVMKIVKRSTINGIVARHEADDDNWSVTVFALGCEDMWITVDTMAEALKIKDTLIKYAFKPAPWWRLRWI